MFAGVMLDSAYQTYRIQLEVLLNIPASASDQDIHNLIVVGFSADTIKTLCDIGTLNPTARNEIIALKTLKTRLARGQQLSLNESDRLFRIVHIIAMSEAIFGDQVKAKRWLLKPKDCFFGKSPIAMLSTTHGARQVEQMLIQLIEGMAF